MKRALFYFTLALVIASTASAWADAFNENRPYSIVTTSTEQSLQSILDNTISNGSINAITGQSDVALWNLSEQDADSYLIKLVTAADGTLGIYSASTGTQINLLALDNAAGFGQVGFQITNNGTLIVNGTQVYANFGKDFGFYWTNSFTEDSKNTGIGYGNDSNIMALSYLVQSGLGITLPTIAGDSSSTASGNNDWILAFEDSAKINGGDGDFNDAVFYMEDLNPVPEPGTLLLLGSGLLGLAAFRLRKRTKA